jgi:hypothetical protein
MSKDKAFHQYVSILQEKEVFLRLLSITANQSKG